MNFSIITPTYNSSETLAETIDSVLSQSGADLEYLIVDGGSTDGSVEIIRAYAMRDPRIRWVSERDRGIADAFNKGVAMATGEWIGILASGDRYAEGALQAVADVLVSDPIADVVHGDMLRLDESGQALFVIVPSGLGASAWHQMPVNHPATFVSRRAYARVGLFDVSLKIAMDYDLILRCYKAGLKFVYLPQPLAEMRYGGVSDNRLLAGLREVRQVSTREGYPAWKANYWLAHRFVVEWIKKFLRRTGLHFLLKLHPRFRKI